MALHHIRGPHDANDLLHDAENFLHNLPDRLGEVSPEDLERELHRHHSGMTTFLQTNLVSDGFVPAVRNDPNLINPWGMSSSTTSPIWISENGAGVASIYKVSGDTATLTGRGLPGEEASASNTLIYELKLRK